MDTAMLLNDLESDKIICILPKILKLYKSPTSKLFSNLHYLFALISTSLLVNPPVAAKSDSSDESEPETKSKSKKKSSSNANPASMFTTGGGDKDKDKDKDKKSKKKGGSQFYCR